MTEPHSCLTLETTKTLGAALVGNSHCAIVYADGDGGIGFWNTGTSRFSATRRPRPQENAWTLSVPEEYRAMHWIGFNRATGSAWRGSQAWSPIEGLHKNGLRIALEVSSPQFTKTTSA